MRGKQKRRGLAPASIRWIRESYLLAGVGTGLVLVVLVSVVFEVLDVAPVVDFFFLVDDFFLWVVVPVVEWVVVSVVAFEVPVVVVCASMPVGSASATARAASFKRDFFISFSFSARGTTHRVTHDANSRDERVNRT
jgi:hypothetical protein